jgi:hypothetical protein
MTHHSNNKKKKNNVIAATASTVVTLAFFVVIAVPGITTMIGINQSADAALMDGSVRFTAEPKAPIAVSEDGNNVYVVWWTNNNTENNNEEVMFRASNDGGQTFGDKINLSNTTAAELEDVEIDAEGANVIVTWWERNQTANEHVMRISNDSGQTFGPLLMLSSDSTLSAASANGEEEEEEEEEEGEGTTISNSSNSSSISNGYDESDATADLTEPSSPDEEEEPAYDEPPPPDEEELDPEDEEEPAYDEPPPSGDSDSSNGNEGTGNNSDSSNSSPPPPPPAPSLPSSGAAHPISYWLENEDGITQDLLEKAAERHNNNNNNEWSFNLGNFRVPIEFDVSDSENDTKGILELYIEGEEVNNDNTNVYDQLAAQLLAAKLNIENDVSTCESIETTVQYANTILRDAQYEGPGSTENPTGESRDYAFEQIQILDRYNNNGCVYK